MLINPSESALLVIDVQQRLLPAMQQSDLIEQNICDLIAVATQLSIPTLYSEQYPKGLGATSDKVLKSLPGSAVRLEKLTFSCAADSDCLEQIREQVPSQVVICGMETHVCVLQTALQLKQLGLEVFVIADAVSSRSEENRQLALERMRQRGVDIVSKEMVIFEWLQQAGTDPFRSISKTYLR